MYHTIRPHNSPSIFPPSGLVLSLHSELDAQNAPLDQRPPSASESPCLLSIKGYENEVVLTSL
jgi:hypothetical protein